jgi:hypothetical protein
MSTHKMTKSLRALACLNHRTQKKRFTISSDMKWTKYEFEGTESE